MQKFEMPITAPLGVLEQKNFGFTSFSLGGTSTPKMIKIGEMRVSSYLRLSWNAPTPHFKETPKGKNYNLKYLFSGNALVALDQIGSCLRQIPMVAYGGVVYVRECGNISLEEKIALAINVYYVRKCYLMPQLQLLDIILQTSTNWSLMTKQLLEKCFAF